MNAITELKLLLAKLDTEGLSVQEMREKDRLTAECLPSLLEIYDWAGRACYLMCDPTEPLHQQQILEMVKEWDRMPKHAEAIKAMGEAWAKGE